MYQAVVQRDASLEGVFFFAVKTTGIFCRPGCRAKTPRRNNVEFFTSSDQALSAGYRRCRPTELAGSFPAWLRPLVERTENQVDRRWTDADLKQLGLSPVRVRRWFQQHYGMTFHAYLRTHKINTAVGQLQEGSDVTSAALQSGFQSLSGFRDCLRKWTGQTPTAAKGKSPIVVDRVLTPLGPMLAAGNDTGLCLLEFADRKMLPRQFQRIGKQYGRAILPGSHEVLAETDRQIQQYFAGTRIEFDLPLCAEASPFQEAVWKELRQIPYGQTRSYRELAQTLGKPNASRAVGRSNGDNRLAIVIPCHRVVRSDGQLCGYAGGLWRKRWLLNHERQSQENQRQLALPIDVS